MSDSRGEYRLMYFNIRARGELLRWIFAASELKWVDHRIGFEDWPAIKPTIEGGQLPQVLTPEGYELTQTAAAARYVAKKGGLVPSNDHEAFRCDFIVDWITSDLFNALLKFVAPFVSAEQRQQGIKKWFETDSVKFFSLFRDWIRKGTNGYLVGGKLTWADLAVASVVDSIGLIPDVKDSLNDFPDVVSYADKIKESGKISDYLKARPEPIAQF